MPMIEKYLSGSAMLLLLMLMMLGSCQHGLEPNLASSFVCPSPISVNIATEEKLIAADEQFFIDFTNQQAMLALINSEFK